MQLNFSPAKIIQWAEEPCNQPSKRLSLLHNLCRIILITIHQFKKNELSLRASALTYTIMLSLVPMLALSTAVVKGLGGGDQLKTAVYRYVENFAGSASPLTEQTEYTETEEAGEQLSSDMTQHLLSAVDQIFDYVDRTNFATLGTFGVAGMLLTVVLVLSNIEMVMNYIWKVDQGRSIMRKIADYLALIILTPISLIVGLASSAVLESEGLLSKFTLFMPMLWIQALILKFIPVFFLALTLYVIYLFFPNTKVKTVPAMAGALFAGFFWFQTQNLYIAMQVGVSRYNAIYGSFATLPLFLIWIYVGWIFILLGAQLAYAVQNRDSCSFVDNEIKPSMKLALAYDLIDYIADRFHQKKQSTIADFLLQYPTHTQKLAKEIRDELIKAEIIHHEEERKDLRPSIPCDQIDQKTIINTILGTTFGATDGGTKSSKALLAAVQLAKAE